MINHAVVILLLKVFIVFVKCPIKIAAMDFNYPIRNMSSFITESNFQQFISNDKGNFTFIAPSSKYIYVVSNGNALLQLSKNTMQLADTFPGKLHCSLTEDCYQKHINLVSLQKENSLLWFCFAQRTILRNVSTEEGPSCFLILEDTFTKSQGQWLGQSFTSSDFFHRTISLTVSPYVYVGIHYYIDKQMHIFKNALTHAGANIPMKTIRLPLNYLRAPGEFIVSFKHKYSVYFLFLETDFSCGFRNNQLQTRLIRICDDDSGTANNEFHALAKINVQCQMNATNKNPPTHVFTVANAAVWMQFSNQLVVSFGSKTNEAQMSVLCLYSIQAIEDAFNSDTKKTSDEPSFIHNSFQNICENFTKLMLSNEHLTDIYTTSKTYPLRRKILSNVTFYQESNSNILHLASDEWISATYQRVMLFLGVEYPRQSAIITMSIEPKLCVLDKFLTTEKITALDLNIDKYSILYIGTSHRLVALPMNLCSVYKSEVQCANFVNPYCGWSRQFNLCSYIANEKDLTIFAPALNICPQVPKDIDDINLKADIPCPLYSTSNPLAQIGLCTCRLMSTMTGRATVDSAKFCKVDGDWSPFSEWSDCSTTCDSGVQSRSRNCDSPLPKNGGAECKGLKIELKPCYTKIECKKNLDSTNQISQFTQWSSWSDCSTTCGFSYQIRTRNCLSGTCPKSPTELKLCQRPLCKSSITSEWSKWSKFSQLSMSKKRFRVHCSETYFYKPSPLVIEVLRGRNDTLTCNNDYCFRKNSQMMLNGHPSLWSSWTPCSASCGVGVKIRNRHCSNDKCLGPTIDIVRCNIHPCTSTWGCWSEWIGCSPECESTRKKVRRRFCVADQLNNVCLGDSVEEKECDLIPCTKSYSQWSMWSSCRTDGVMIRTRKCKSRHQCMLPLLQSKPCARSSTDRPLLFSSIYMIVSAIVGIVIGVLIGSIICYIWWRCTMSVIRKTHSDSQRFSNPIQNEDIYNSQSLNTLPDTVSSIQRQRSSSGSELYYQSRNIPTRRDDIDQYNVYPPPTTFYNTPYLAGRQPLPGVQEL